MLRRTFLATAVAAPAVAAAQNVRKTTQKKANKPFLMKLGMQDHMSDEDLAVYSSIGVEAVCTALPSKRLDDKWSVEALEKERARVESYGIKLVMIPLPLSSVEIDKAEYPAIMLGKSPDRDRAIDDICQMIRNVAKAGIPAVKYNMSILGVVRSPSVKGRGKSVARAFNYDKAIQEPPLTMAGRVTEEMAWERITYFLKRVVPVAEEYKVRMACHPHDPGMPKGKGFRGVERVLGSVDGLKKFIDIVPSEYHGLNFCQGTVSEMLQNPAKEIFDVIRYFGTRRKIFNVHFRNIKGHFLDFQEAFPDEGDVDMAQAMRTYREIGYDGMIMPDHVPGIPGDGEHYTGGPKGFAFALGYTRGIMQMVAKES